MTWQYNGVADFNEMYQWCRQNLADQFTCPGWETFYFRTEQAYLYFVLRWL